MVMSMNTTHEASRIRYASFLRVAEARRGVDVSMMSFRDAADDAARRHAP